jgi:flagellar basal body-associated protein FliL
MGKKVSLPIIALRTPKKGKAIWIFSGIHGEEPAGPNAISESKVIEYLKNMGKTFHIVLLPLCNPLGYLRNWRYVNQEKWDKNSEGQSVGDSEHYLLDLKNKNLPRRKNPSCMESGLLTKYVVDNSQKYLPLMSFDFHEDDLISKGYVYSHGKLKQKDPIAKEIVEILLKSGVKIQTEGKSRFGEEIRNGIIKGGEDGSIDDLLSTYKIIVNNKILPNLAAKTAIVIETPAKEMKLEERKKAHMNILLSLHKLIKNF